MPNGKKTIIAKRDLNISDYSDGEKERNENLKINMGLKTKKICTMQISIHSRSMRAGEPGGDPSEMTGVDSEQLSVCLKEIFLFSMS